MKRLLGQVVVFVKFDRTTKIQKKIYKKTRIETHIQVYVYKVFFIFSFSNHELIKKNFVECCHVFCLL